MSGVTNILNILSESRDRLLTRIAKLEAELAECEFQASTKSDKDRILQLEAENERLKKRGDKLAASVPTASRHDETDQGGRP